MINMLLKGHEMLWHLYLLLIFLFLLEDKTALTAGTIASLALIISICASRVA
jgi:hypothetical protein